MKIISILLLTFLFSCNKIDYKYKIYSPNFTKDKSAVFYTDTIMWEGDIAYYKNSDGTKVVISIDSLKDCQIDTIKYE